MASTGFKVGDKVAYRNVGYGLTSYESYGDTVTEIENGRLFTESFSSEGMELRNSTWVYDGGLGMRTELVRPDDPEVLAYLEEYGED